MTTTDTRPIAGQATSTVPPFRRNRKVARTLLLTWLALFLGGIVYVLVTVYA
jgi:hypothetical protein